ncbi:MAG: winged helix-turn-helix transcriptional regulator [Methanomassiliicoccus sp.]|nr:winged helix-turn-helix transcriptional regulator [Methanomassiliicoccus sp.]
MILEKGVVLVEVLGNRWNMRILWILREGPLRFTELKKRMGDVNSKTITEHLRVLERYHVIDRAVFAEVPPRVEYSLTEHGRAFLPVFKVIYDWAASLPPPKEN